MLAAHKEKHEHWIICLHELSICFRFIFEFFWFVFGDILLDTDVWWATRLGATVVTMDVPFPSLLKY